jgi:hypothetical protein
MQEGLEIVESKRASRGNGLGSVPGPEQTMRIAAQRAQNYRNVILMFVHQVK